MRYERDSTGQGSTLAAAPARPDQSEPRSQNERLVLTLIRRDGPSSKAEIARVTGLSAQTVSVIMRGLEAEGLLQRCEPVRGKVGQPQVPMRLAPGGAYFLGLKVGRRSLDLVLTDFTGAVVDRRHLVHPYPAPDGVVRFVNDSISDLLVSLPPEGRERVAGLGIALPFRLWDWAGPLGVRDADMAPWRHRDIRAEIAARWHFPVYLQNDATAACGAELAFGGTEGAERERTEGASDFLYFFVGYFIGGGVVLNRRIYPGASGNAGAIGSMPVTLADGRAGQLVDAASLMRLEEAALARGVPASEIWERPEGWNLPADLLDKWIAQAADGLAQAIRAAASVIDFEEAVIDGWIPPEVRAALTRATAERLEAHPLAGVALPAVRAGRIGSDARALGAASQPLAARFLLDT